jgi:hypothetical protein
MKESVMTFTLNVLDLGLIVLYCLGVTVCIFVIITLVNANKLIKKIDGIAVRNMANIDETLAQLPDFSRNVNHIAAGVGKGIDKVGSVIGLVDNALVRTISAIARASHNVLEIITAIRNKVMGIHGKASSKES